MVKKRELQLIASAFNRVPRGVFDVVPESWEDLGVRYAGLFHRIYFYRYGSRGQIPGLECESQCVWLDDVESIALVAPALVTAEDAPLTCIACYAEWLRRMADSYE